ncbi:MAG: helix-turn-helix domain-containing protein [Thermoleophilia bacterium]|nr:helix-turn-helix domain-containing protein [Thermoleophilia bacterium]
MRHRHLEIADGTPVAELGLEAIDNVLDRGDLSDWQPLLRAVRRDPRGAVSERVLHLVERHPMHGTSALWRSWIEALRAEAEPVHVGQALGALRRARSLTQQRVADVLEMTQPEVSKLEQRRDVRVSTLRAYVAALGGQLALSARFADGEEPIFPTSAEAPREERPIRHRPTA